jgi:glycosyltransferase involved in cell wall biosynthesis
VLSLIIITKNEEKYLPRLLDSIKRQRGYKDYEIIVADANSTDRTREIAKEYGCRVVDGGLPSIGRNNGVRASTGDILLFADSDVVFHKTFLKKILRSFKAKNLDVGGVYLKVNGGNIIDNAYYNILNLWFFLMQRIYPHAVGSCILCKKKVHKKINGFNEEIVLAEDNDYVNRAGKNFKFGMVNTRIFVSPRRFEKEGRLKMGVKYLIILFYRLLFGEIKKDIFKYRFSHYEDK